MSMGDLISRTALIAELSNLDPPGFCSSVAGMVAIKKIKEAPSVDAVEVVRCKDCEIWNDGWFPECTMGKCKRGKPVLTEPHHYCSHGVRRPDIPVIIKDESFVVKEDG